MFINKIVPKFFLLLVMLLLLNIVSVLLGDSKSSLTVINKTTHYLHIRVQGKMYPYVAPNWSVTHETGIVSSMDVRVIYSPGEGLEEAVFDTTIAIPYTPSQTSGTSSGCDCADDTYDCKTVNTSTTPAQGGSAAFEVTQTYLN